VGLVEPEVETLLAQGRIQDVSSAQELQEVDGSASTEMATPLDNEASENLLGHSTNLPQCEEPDHLCAVRRWSLVASDLLEQQETRLAAAVEKEGLERALGERAHKAVHTDAPRTAAAVFYDNMDRRNLCQQTVGMQGGAGSDKDGGEGGNDHPASTMLREDLAPSIDGNGNFAPSYIPRASPRAQEALIALTRAEVAGAAGGVSEASFSPPRLLPAAPARVASSATVISCISSAPSSAISILLPSSASNSSRKACERGKIRFPKPVTKPVPVTKPATATQTLRSAWKVYTYGSSGRDGERKVKGRKRKSVGGETQKA